MRFEDKVVLITGGSRGIGKAIVQEFANQGATVYFTYKSNEKLALDIQGEEAERGNVVVAIKCDITKNEDVEYMIEEIENSHKKINILINNAGITKDSYFMMMSKLTWHEVMDTNLNGTFNVIQAILPNMYRAREGAIVNISSVSGVKGAEGQANYSASKFGLIGLTKSIAKEVGRKNIRVNAVAPGYIETEMTEKIPEDLKKACKNMIPFKRFGRPEEVAKVVAFLSSNDSTYINGEVIVVDGGFTS